MKTNIYIDGLNLYYRLLKDRPELKWLNLEALCTQILRASNDINLIRYFTARVSSRVDPHAPARQQIYLEALKTLPKLTIHMGNFSTRKVWAGLVHPPQFKGGHMPSGLALPYPKVVRVWKTEEKGSDVNIATYLLRDAFKGEFEAAALLTNDTDLVEPIRVISEEIGLPVGLLCPVSQPAVSLKQVASFVRHIEPHHLRKAQFPDTIPKTSIVKPSNWAVS